MDLDDPRLAPFRALRTKHQDDDVIVEGAVAVARLLARAGEGDGVFTVRSVVATPSHGERLRPLVDALGTAVRDAPPLFELPRRELKELAGFDFHRGVLACVRRPPARAAFEPRELEALRRRARVTVVVASGLADPRNLGAVIRNAAAFGVDWVVVDGHGADVFSRLSVRVSVGNVFRVPLLVSDDLGAIVEELRRELPAKVVAATPAGEVELGSLRGPASPAKRVILVGNEGAGLPDAQLRLADLRVRIPVVEGSDSINVAAATAVLLYALS